MGELDTCVVYYQAVYSAKQGPPPRPLTPPPQTLLEAQDDWQVTKGDSREHAAVFSHWKLLDLEVKAVLGVNGLK